MVATAFLNLGGRSEVDAGQPQPGGNQFVGGGQHLGRRPQPFQTVGAGPLHHTVHKGSAPIEVVLGEVEAEEPGQPVRPNGMLVALGPLVQANDIERTVQVRRYLDEDNHRDSIATVTASGETWSVVLAEAR